MRIIPVTFIAILVLSMTTSSALMVHPQEPIPQAFAQSTEYSIRDLGDYVVFGFDEVEIEKEVTVITGSVGAQNKKSEVEIDEKVTFEDPNSAVVGDEVEIDKKALVQDVYYNKLKNKGEILGTENTPLVLPVIDRFPYPPDLMPGDESIEVEQGESLSLPQGQYDKIVVKKGATLIFEGGEYSASSIKAEKETTILFDDTSSVIVHDKIKIGKKSFFGPSEGSKLSASEILIFGVGNERESYDDDNMDYGNDEKDDDNKTKIEFKKESIVFANVFAPNGKIEIGKETHATGAFVANKVQVGEKSTLKLDSQLQIITLVDEYLDLISKMDSIGSNIDETTITPEFISSINSDLIKVKEIVVELQILGFDGKATAVRIDQQMVGTVSFIDSETSELLFETQIPDGTLGIFAAIGLYEEYLTGGVELTFDQLVELLHSSPALVEAIANFNNDKIASNFVLASIAAFHPSTGNTFVVLIAIGIGLAINFCMTNDACLETIKILLEESGKSLLEFLFPLVTVTGIKFNDKNANGIRDDPLVEKGIPEWRFIMSDVLDFDPTNPFVEELTDENGEFAFVKKRVPRPTDTIFIIETSQEGWEVTTSQGLVHEIPFVAPPPPLPFEEPLVFVPPPQVFGNRQIAPITGLTVIKNIINDDTGTAVTSDFTISVTGTNVSPSSFLGDLSGTTVTLDEGSYTVTEIGPNGYIGTYSADCSGTINLGETKTCTITNDDLPPPTFPVLAIDVSPQNGGNACSIGNTLARDGATAGLDYRVFGFGTGGLGMLPGTTPFVAGCIAADFGEVKDPGPVTVTAGRTDNACGRGCTGTNCNRPTEVFLVFSSTDLSTYSFVASSPTAPPNQSLGSLRDYAFSISDPFRYIAVCRSGAGPAASDVMVDSIVTGGFSNTPLPPSLLSSPQPGGPYFYPELNQTSVNATKPEVVTVPLKVEWESGYYTSPVTVEINNMTSGVSYTVNSVQNATHYKLFDMIFNVTSTAQVGEHVFEVLVTEISTSDTNSEEIRLNVE